jgi:hypothetical protein
MIQKEHDHDEADVEARQSRHTKDELKDLSQQAAGQSRRGRPRGAIMIPPVNVGNIFRMDLDIICLSYSGMDASKQPSAERFGEHRSILIITVFVDFWEN